jgi:hypothetical protein
MSIEVNYRRITPAEFQRLQNDPQSAGSFFGISPELLEDPEKLMAMMVERRNNRRFLDLGKDWHALHFLLTGDFDLKPHPLPPPPLGNVVFGGTKTDWLGTYGNIQSLAPQEVRDVADALTGIPVQNLRAKFSVASFNDAQIYPHGRRKAWTEEDAETVFEIYLQVVSFFQAAAKAGDMILITTD